MKYLLIALLGFAVSAQAAENCSTHTSEYSATEKMEIKTDVPSHLEGATITVTLKDGRTSTVPAEQFKVVPRKQQYLVTKMDRSTVKSCSPEEQRHRISVLGGYGAKDGLDRDNSQAPDEVSIKSRTGVVGGAQYQYKTGLKVWNLPVSVGAQGQSNKTGSVMLGLDF